MLAGLACLRYSTGVMDYRHTTFAAAFHDAKNAALYFDHVLPAEFAELMRDKGDLRYYEIARSLLPVDLLDSTTTTGLRDEVISCVARYIFMFPELFTGEEVDAATRDARVAEHLPKFLEALSDVVTLSQLSITDLMLGPPDVRDAPTGEGTPSLILSGLNLIDTQEVSWPQIVEFRKDAEAKAALSRLRLFVYSQYSGKPRDFIEDDLGERIRVYERTVRKWGFATKTAALKAIVGSTTTLAVVGATVSTLFGAPLAVVLAGAAAGIALDIAGISLTVAEKIHDRNDFSDTSSVAYLVEASRRLADTKSSSA